MAHYTRTWAPLLEFTDSNPLALEAVVGQALHEGVRQPSQVEDFLERLRSGRLSFVSNRSWEVPRTLIATLGCGFFQASSDGEQRLSRRTLERSWVEAEGVQTNGLFEAFSGGDLSRLPRLRAEEANFLQARRLARRVTSAMQGLQGLYDHTGRRLSWAQLVDDIVPEYVDLETGDPVPGRELRWHLVTGYRVRLARERGETAAAEHWQERLVKAQRSAAAEALRNRSEHEREERYALRSLGTALHELGQIRREMAKSDCVGAYMEAIELAADLGDRAGASACALNLGHAYEDLPEIRDLDQAELWYRRSLAVRPKHDLMGRGLCLGSLGSVARERFLEAQDQQRPTDELRTHLHEARRLYHEDLDCLPTDAVSHRAVAHGQLGNTYGDLGETDRALFHYREAIRFEEMAADRFGAASQRYNAAFHLRESGSLSDAMSYAQSALRGFEASGERGTELVRKTRLLMDDIRERQGIRADTRQEMESVLGSVSILDELPPE